VKWNMNHRLQCLGLLVGLTVQLAGCRGIADDQTRTIYPMDCSVPFVGDRCDGKTQKGPSEEFRVDVGAQRVVHLDGLGPVALENCAVFSSDDWKCDDSGWDSKRDQPGWANMFMANDGRLAWVSRGGHPRMEGGVYREDKTARVRYVSWWHWLMGTYP